MRPWEIEKLTFGEIDEMRGWLRKMNDANRKATKKSGGAGRGRRGGRRR